MEEAEAHRIFRAQAVARGLVVNLDDSSLSVDHDGASLRLRLDESSRIVLEVTHGPPGEPPVGWLDLYCDPPDPNAPSFVVCLEYGLDLFRPRADGRT